MDNELKYGDLVTLKSGGPIMTIDNFGSRKVHVPTELGEMVCNLKVAHCLWFDGTMLQKEQFDLSSLVLQEAND